MGIDLTGKRYGRLLVISMSEKRRGGQLWFNCLCDCGKTKTVISQSLRIGCSRSCGCLRAEQSSVRTRKIMTTHKMTKTPTYNSWKCMRQRCNNKNAKNYYNYGGAGVKISQKWNTFAGFFRDMGEKPTKFHSLDRIDNNGNYEPGNCRWATARQQANNKKNNRIVTIEKRSLTVAQWCRINNLKPKTVYERLKSGWPPEIAVSKP